MKLDLIRSFALLGEVKHFGETARQLGISQPSLTKQIRRLEDILGAPLFIRSRRGTELTTLGRQILADAQPMLRSADLVWERSLRAARGEQGHLAIGFNFSAVDLMAQILHKFTSAFPEIMLSFHDASSEDQAASLKDGSLDIGFLRIPAGDGLASYRIGSDGLALVYPVTLTGKVEREGFSALTTLPYVALRETVAPGMEAFAQRVFAKADFQPTTIHRVNGSLTVLSLVSAGFGFSLVHESVLKGPAGAIGSIASRNIQGTDLRWDIGIVWRKNEPSPIVKQFLKIAREVRTQRQHGDKRSS